MQTARQMSRTLWSAYERTCHDSPLCGARVSGSVLYCRFVPLLLLKKDICALSPDKNPGAANVFVHCGVPMGLLCLVLDMAKGGVPVALALRKCPDLVCVPGDFALFDRCSRAFKKICARARARARLAERRTRR